MPDVILHFDGAAWRNPGGVATYGWVVETGLGARLAEGSGVAARDCPTATNNVAEYTGLLKGLGWLIASGLDPGSLMVRGDSNLVVQQIDGKWNCNAPHLRELRNQCVNRMQLLREAGWTVRLEWVGRGENAVADGLSTAAWEKATGWPFPDLSAMMKRR